MTLSRQRSLVVGICFAIALGAAAWCGEQFYLHDTAPMRPFTGVFLVKPYLQLGLQSDPQQPEIVWATTNESAAWHLQIQPQGTSTWTEVSAIARQPISLEGLPSFVRYEAQLPRLPRGKSIAYRVLRDGKEQFHATIRPTKSQGDPVHIAVTGDIASGAPEQRDVARAIEKWQPDLVLVAGDIVYKFGLTTEYLDHFFPVYNADTVSDAGCPLLRQTLMVAAPGNHDLAWGSGYSSRQLDLFSDGLGYFVWWRQGLNGPDLVVQKSDICEPTGSPQRIQAFLNAAGRTYPREQNFSFNYGNSHWTVIDADDYVDWSHPYLQQWLARDLDSAPASMWKFVIFHQSPFSSDKHHFFEQRMRILCPLFQQHGVDIVFSGHMHNYQRSYPLTFSPTPLPDGRLIHDDGTVDGRLQLDRGFDGAKSLKPHGVIYVITGAGGAALGDAALNDKPEQWQPYTCRFISKHSFTACDINANTLHIRQIGTDGKVLDEFSLTK